jgi:hypothetical protein
LSKKHPRIAIANSSFVKYFQVREEFKIKKARRTVILEIISSRPKRKILSSTPPFLILLIY